MTTAADPRAAAVVAWIDEDRERRAREDLREQGRNQMVRALLKGELKIRDVVTGAWMHIPSPWTDADVERWGVTREQLAEMTISHRGLPPDSDGAAAALARLDALRSLT